MRIVPEKGVFYPRMEKCFRHVTNHGALSCRRHLLMKKIQNIIWENKVIVYHILNNNIVCHVRITDLIMTSLILILIIQVTTSCKTDGCPIVHCVLIYAKVRSVTCL